LTEAVVEQNIDQLERFSEAVGWRPPAPPAVTVIRIVAITDGPIAVIRILDLIALCAESVIELNAIATV
jgi:hypothetical protein